MSIFSALKRAARALTTPDAGQAIIAGATVRPYEVAAGTLRSQRMDAQQLVSRFMGTVKIAASTTAAAVASVPIRVYRQSGNGQKTAWSTRECRRKDWSTAGTLARKAFEQSGDAEEINDPRHPLVKLLKSVNQRDNGFTLVEDTTLWLDLAGNGYWNMPGEGAPLGLWPLAPQYVHAIPDPTKFIRAYVYGRGTEIEREFTAERMIHFRMPNPLGNPYRGRGSLEACIEEADLSRAFAQFGLAMLQNGAQPGMVFSSEQWVTPDQVEVARDQFERLYQGRFKAGRSLFLGGKVDAKPWIMGEKEIGFLQSAERVDQVIANCFDMPVSILRLDTAALATAHATVPQWQMRAIRPRCRRIEDTLNAKLVPLFGDDLFVCFDESVDRDTEADTTQATSLYGARIVTLNEAREMVGRDPAVGVNGDEFATDPVQAAADAKAAQVADTPTKKPAKELRRVKVIDGEPDGPCCTHKDQVYDRQIDQNERDTERRLAAMLLLLGDDIRESVTESGAIMDIGTNAKAKAAFDAATGPGLEAAARDGIARGVSETAEESTVRGEVEKQVAGIVRAQQDRAWESVSQTLQERVESSVTAAKEMGGGLAEMRAAVDTEIKAAAATTPENVAGLEIGKAYMESREKVWTLSGVVKYKRWKLAKGACAVCVAVAGIYNALMLPPGEPLLQRGESMMLNPELGLLTAAYCDLYGPPLHSRCKCAFEPVFAETHA